MPEMSMEELINWMPGYDEWIEPDIEPELDIEPEPDRVMALTLWQPWASLIAIGLKRYETRSWRTNYRGKLLIHAAKRPMDAVGLEVWEEAHKLKSRTAANASSLPLGKIIAIADLTACLEIIGDLSKSPDVAANIHLQTETELLCGDWQAGKFAWKLENVKPLVQPITAKGKQGLWVPESLDKIVT